MGGIGRFQDVGLAEWGGQEDGGSLDTEPGSDEVKDVSTKLTRWDGSIRQV